MSYEVLGIDFGASAVKGGIVDLKKGEMITERFKVTTGVPPAPMEAALDGIDQVIKHFNWTGDVGIGFPSVIKQNAVQHATNIDEKWVGADIGALVGKMTKGKVSVINDADAAGLAERAFGAGRDEDNTLLLLTLGTGIGSALFINGHLVPNTELGHLIMKGKYAEKYCSSRVKSAEDLSYRKWAQRLNKYLLYVEHIINPDLILLGGGISRKFDRYANYLTINTPIKPAEMRNIAGVVGAGMATRI